MLYKVTMTPRQLGTLHRWACLNGRDGHEFADIEIDQDEDGVLLVGQGDARAQIRDGAPAETETEAERLTRIAGEPC